MPLWNCCTPIARNLSNSSSNRKTHCPFWENSFKFGTLFLLFILWLAVKISCLAVWITMCSFQIQFSLCLSLVKVFGVCLVQQALSRCFFTINNTLILVRELLPVQVLFRVFWLIKSRLVSCLNSVNIHKQKTGKRWGNIHFKRKIL